MKTSIKWTEVTQACVNISNKVKKNKIDIIVAVSRGGLIPARLIAKHLKIRRIYSLGMESYSDDTNKANEINIYQSFTEKFPKNCNILVVDDIVDKGTSLRHALNNIGMNRTESATVISCAIHYKKCSIIKPDVFYKEVDENNWIIYPWE